MGVVMYASMIYIPSNGLKLMVASIVGVLLYFLLGFLLKLNEIEEIKKIVLLKIKNK